MDSYAVAASLESKPDSLTLKQQSIKKAIHSKNIIRQYYCQKCSLRDRLYIPLFYRCTVCRLWMCLDCTYKGYYMTICLKHKIEKQKAIKFKDYNMEHYLVCGRSCAKEFESGQGLNRYLILLEENDKLKKRCCFMTKYVERDFS